MTIPLQFQLFIAHYSKSSAAAFKLDIVRRALNLGQDLSLTKDPEHSYIHYPIIQLKVLLITKRSLLHVIIGEMKEKNIMFSVLV